MICVSVNQAPRKLAVIARNKRGVKVMVTNNRRPSRFQEPVYFAERAFSVCDAFDNVLADDGIESRGSEGKGLADIQINKRKTSITNCGSLYLVESCEAAEVTIGRHYFAILAHPGEQMRHSVSPAAAEIEGLTAITDR
jgi:hypothetical protein